MKLGSLCSGYGGLDLALGLPVAWHVEYDAAPSKILATRFPGVPNYGDLTAVDWAALEPVDVLTAGYPCQPFSHAGKRKGTNDDRHLWPYVADAVRVLRPGLVFLENVAGHLSLGFGDVLGDLARLGYDARWCCVRASDVGAPHQRKRLFVVATDAGGAGAGWVARAVPGPLAGPRRPGLDVRPVGDDRGPAPDADGDGLGRVAQLDRGAAPRLDGAPRGHADRRRVENPRGPGLGEHEPAPDAASAGWGQHPRGGRGQVQGPEVDERAPVEPRRRGRSGEDRRAVDWGAYGPAIDRWARVTGRDAPAPVDDRGRLAPAFVEWMMGLPAGWVTDVDIPRTAQLRALGNGVVPQQAAHAWQLLAHLQEAA